MTIGERLEEARKRKGISISEASEITKIRGDILHGLENNETEFKLPDVYIRGFLRNYSNFLSLDAEKILTDFTAMQLRITQQVRPETREYLGQMNLSEKTPIEPPLASSKEEDLPKPDERQITATNVYKSSIDKDLYYKVAMVFGGTFLLVIIIILLVNLVISDDTPEINPDLREDITTEGSNENFSDVAPMIEEQIKIIAIDDVTVIVEQRIDRKKLLSRTLAEGETVILTTIGPIKISFTEGENVVIEKDGNKFGMGVTGTGIRYLN